MREDEVKGSTRKPFFLADPIELCMLLLGIAAGISDVIGYTKLGQVLPSAMTGNTALMGLALGQGRLLAATRSIAALLAFASGAAIASFMLGDGPRPRPARAVRVLAIEIIALAWFAAVWIATAPDAGEAALYTMIVLAAASMGMQSALARRIDLPGITTVVFTSTLTAIVGAVADAIRKRNPLLSTATKRQLVALAAYVAAACLAGFVVWQGSEIICVLPLVAVLGAFSAQGWRWMKERRAA